MVQWQGSVQAAIGDRVLVRSSIQTQLNPTLTIAVTNPDVEVVFHYDGGNFTISTSGDAAAIAGFGAATGPDAEYTYSFSCRIASPGEVTAIVTLDQDGAILGASINVAEG